MIARYIMYVLNLIQSVSFIVVENAAFKNKSNLVTVDSLFHSNHTRFQTVEIIGVY